MSQPLNEIVHLLKFKQFFPFSVILKNITKWGIFKKKDNSMSFKKPIIFTICKIQFKYDY